MRARSVPRPAPPREIIWRWRDGKEVNSMANHLSGSVRDLVEQATRFLRARGYTWSGRERRKVDSGQCAFERRMVLTPFRGASRPRK